MNRGLAILAIFALGVAAAGCGTSYNTSGGGGTTGQDAAPLGEVHDIVVELPHLRIDTQPFAGVMLTLRLDLDAGNAALRNARATYGAASTPLGPMAVEDLGTGRTQVALGSGAYRTGRLGPLRIGNTSFDLLLDGQSDDGGWTSGGGAWESQTALGGSFEGGRRHRFLVTVTDFGLSGQVALVERRFDGLIATIAGLGATSPDPELRRSGSAVLVINRLSYDNLQRLDPSDRFATAWQSSVGRGANPHDALLYAGETLFVTRYEPPFDDLLVLDPRTGSQRGTIPLAELAENRDKTPRPHELALADGTLFVGLQDIDRTFTRYADGKLAVVDPQNRELRGVIPLPGKNPGDLRALTARDGRPKLFVALGGIFPGLLGQELSGGVAVVDVRNRAFERWALDDDDAGGNVGALALFSERLGYVAVSDDQYRQRILAFDPETATVLRQIDSVGDLVTALELTSGGVLAIPERSFTAPRLCLYAVPATQGEVERPLGCAPLPAPPFGVAALD